MSGDARTVVLTLGAVLLLVLGGVLVCLWRQRRRSRIAISLTLGAFILVGGLWVFADAIVGLDPAVMHWFQAHATPEVTAVMWAVSWLGSRPVVGALSALVALGLAVEPCWSVLVEWLLVVPGGMLLNTLLKGLVDRPRAPERPHRNRLRELPQQPHGERHALLRRPHGRPARAGAPSWIPGAHRGGRGDASHARGRESPGARGALPQ